MRHHIATLLAVAALAIGAGMSAKAQTGDLLCEAFVKNADGSWTAIHSVRVPGAGHYFNVAEGATFKPGMSFAGLDLAAQLEQECPAVAAAAPAPGAAPQVELSKLAGPSGSIDVQTFTCDQLASTYQEDADFLLAWYSGWTNGLAKVQTLNLPKVKEQTHKVIVYCKANRARLVSQAITEIAKAERRQ